MSDAIIYLKYTPLRLYSGRGSLTFSLKFCNYYRRCMYISETAHVLLVVSRTFVICFTVSDTECKVTRHQEAKCDIQNDVGRLRS